MSEQVAVDVLHSDSLTGGALAPGQADALAGAFKALGDPVRLRLLSMIASNPDGEVCVCDLTSAFDVTGPTISHHLRVLRQAGLVDCQRRGTWVYYRSVPGTLARLAHLITPAARPATRTPALVGPAGATRNPAPAAPAPGADAWAA